METRLVVVSYDTLTFADKKVVLPGGAKAGNETASDLHFLIADDYATRSIGGEGEAPALNSARLHRKLTSPNA